MVFFPLEKIEYKTNLTVKEIRNRIIDLIEPKGVFWIFFFKKYSYGKKYQGEIHENDFKFRRIIYYANPFLPFIEGKIIDNTEHRIINIRMRCSYFVVGFIILLLGLILISLLIYLIKAKSIIEIISIFAGTLIFIIFGYLIMIIPFKIESKIVKKH